MYYNEGWNIRLQKITEYPQMDVKDLLQFAPKALQKKYSDIKALQKRYPNIYGGTSL
jgi:hypothetical protein